MDKHGFTLLELVIVICIIGLLIALAVARLLPLRVEAERAALEQVLGGLRAGLAMEMVSLVARGRDQEINRLPRSNPMNYLMQAPSTYLGELEAVDPAGIPPGRWYFDLDSHLLVYRVRYANHFSSPLPGPARARFDVKLMYEDLDGSGSFEAGLDRLGGIQIQPVEPYRWSVESDAG